jgi:CubicO group peptidase (beta-lactamase class C family)
MSAGRARAASPIEAALAAGLAEGVAPALSAVVLRGGRRVHASVCGALPEPDARPLRPDDLFDLASLTKPLATATVVAQLVWEGHLDLDAPVARWLPGFAAGGKAAVTVRHVLAHSGGLVGWRPWFEACARDPVAGAAFLPPERRPGPDGLAGAFARGKDLLRAAVLGEPAERPPGGGAVYSDAGFLALGFLVEAVEGDLLSRVAARRVFARLGLRATGFRDGLDPAASEALGAGRSFVPTERCAHRGEVNRGAVNDDNAWAVGGGAGHAGLFGTAEDAAAIGQAWLDAVLRGDGRGVVPPPTAREFARRDGTPGSTRALGWDTPSAEGSSLGARLGRGPRGALGHLGFTGTSLWIDLDAEVVAVLLTNRVHPTRDNERIRGFRPRFHDAVAEELGIG